MIQHGEHLSTNVCNQNNKRTQVAECEKVNVTLLQKYRNRLTNGSPGKQINNISMKK